MIKGRILIQYLLLFIYYHHSSEALHAWRTKARCNIVPAERLHELFEELEFNPTEKQSEFSRRQSFFATGLQRSMKTSQYLSFDYKEKKTFEYFSF